MMRDALLKLLETSAMILVPVLIGVLVAEARGSSQHGAIAGLSSGAFLWACQMAWAASHERTTR